MRLAISITTAAVLVAGLVSPVTAAPQVASVKSTEITSHEVRTAVVKKKKKRGAKVCPTKNFWLGAGWGADRGRRKHVGVDLGAKRGTPIFAVEAGRINRTKRQSNGALQIVLQGKSGSKYYYGHMDKVLIKSKQRVKKGQVIGRMGDTGSPGQVHLHFEYWRSGGESAAVNPMKLLKRICKTL